MNLLLFSNKKQKCKKKERQEKSHALNIRIHILTIYNDLILTPYVNYICRNGLARRD